MATLWLVIQREFVSNVLTSRFMIGFLICLMSTAAAVFVQVEDYEKRLAAYLHRRSGTSRSNPDMGPLQPN